MRAAGAPEAVIARKRAEWEAARPTDELIEVYPENIDAFMVLVATADQWTYPGVFGGELQLPLSEVKTAMELLDLATDKASVLRVLTIVRAARAEKVKAFNAALAKAR